MIRILNRFLRREAGVVSVETVIMFPLLLWAFAAMFVFFDVFKSNMLNVKATYTVADLISRYRNADAPMDEEYIDGMNQIYGFLTARNTNGNIRVTAVSHELTEDGENERDRFDWSYGTGPMQPHTTLQDIQDLVPKMHVGGQTIIVETRTDWTPAMRFGLDARTLFSSAMTSPRFVSRIPWEGDGAGSGTSYTGQDEGVTEPDV